MFNVRRPMTERKARCGRAGSVAQSRIAIFLFTAPTLRLHGPPSGRDFLRGDGVLEAIRIEAIDAVAAGLALRIHQEIGIDRVADILPFVINAESVEPVDIRVVLRGGGFTAPDIHVNRQWQLWGRVERVGAEIRPGPEGGGKDTNLSENAAISHTHVGGEQSA